MKNIKIAVIGLGYVGLPVSVVLSKKYSVIGYDINKDRVKDINMFNDSTLEISSEDLAKSLEYNLAITSKISDIKDCNIYIITVPTPINKDKSPNLNPLKKATEAVGKILSKDNIVIYESTVYPGCTEEVCVPILEKTSRLKYNVGFFCGYSPERINPGDKNRTIEKIKKVTSGSTPTVANIIDSIYSSVIDAGTYMAESIKVAEAAKVIENAQRDINIAFVNELSIIFNKMNIDTNDVLNAASTKWNFLNFRPGLVGGHCIGVDPYYLSNKAQRLGYNPEIILSGRRVNDNMGSYVASNILKLMEERNQISTESKVLILGTTFKENCPDFRNTKVIDIIKNLKKVNLKVDVYDPWINIQLFKKEYKIEVLNKLTGDKYDAIVLAVAHNLFNQIDLLKLKRNKNSVVYETMINKLFKNNFLCSNQ
jgi:UDP-N-acetyl-D-galactosamine dehydrogenase